MVGILIVSHGDLSEAFISSIQSLVGGLQKVRGVSIWPKDQQRDVEERLQKEMEMVNEGDGVVILTDVLGGTPTNLTLSFLADEKVEIVTGVNLPMLLTLLSYRKGRSLKEIVKLAKKSGRRSITVAKALAKGRTEKRNLIREKNKVNHRKV